MPWLLKCEILVATRIGEDCKRFINWLFKDRVLDQWRAAQGVMQLEKAYGANAACRRARHFGTINYRSVKNILKQGVEYAAIDEETAFDQLADSYTGSGQFSRDTKQLLQ